MINKNGALFSFWERLKSVQTLKLHAKNMQGNATVSIHLEMNNSLVFYEKGTWIENAISFTNILRWKLSSDKISLEHLRFGVNSPTFLVDLLPKDNYLSSLYPHFCKKDIYSAQAFLSKKALLLKWTIQGPKKAAELSCYYM